MIRRGEHGRVRAQQLPAEAERLVGFLVGRADVALADRRAAVCRPVSVHVVVVRVRVTIHVGRCHQAHELVLEFVSDGRAEHQQVGLNAEPGERPATDRRNRRGPDDVAQVRPVRVLPFEALLDVGALVDDPGLKRREIGGRRTREVRVEGLFERRSASAAAVACVRARDRGEGDSELREIRRDLDGLEVETGGLPGERTQQRYLHVRPLAGRKVGDGAQAVLGGGRRDDENAVVVGRGVIRGVVDIEVEESIRVHGRRERRVGELQLFLLGRTERRRDIRPSVGGIEVDPLVGDTEGVRARRLAREVVVRDDAAVREEAPEVDDRPLERRDETTRANPLDRNDRLVGSFGRLLDRVSLKDPRGERARAAGERGAGPVERVVGGAALARVGSGRERVPADAGVRREGLNESVIAADALLHEGLVRRHEACGCVRLHEVRAHPVRGEEDRLLSARLVAGRFGGRCWHRQHRQEQRQDGQKDGGSESSAAGHGTPPRLIGHLGGWQTGHGWRGNSTTPDHTGSNGYR